MTKYLEYIDSHKDEMLKSLQGLLAFDSVVREGESGTIFGVETQKALEYMLDMAKQDGFATVNTDNRAGHIEMGKGDEIVGVLVHLDIVPAGNDWDYDPFGKDIAEGRLYGRGVIDDKGPAMMAYYAMKAIREAAKNDPNFELKKRVRLILGLDEEKGAWNSISYYFQKEDAPNIGFTPDNQFPVIHGEMGILIFELVKKLNKNRDAAGLIVKNIKGGNAHNMVADYCTAVVSGEQGYEDIKKKAVEFSENTGYKISCKGRGKAFEITTTGVSAHGAAPQQGLNAISVMMAFLVGIGVGGDEINEFIEFYNSKIGFNLYGENIGCGFSDEVSGKLLFNVGEIHVNEETAALTICVRYPVTGDGGSVYDGIRDSINQYNLGVVKIEDKKPIYFPLESPLVTTLTEIYQRHTGDFSSKPITSGGGTYARAAKNIIAFGPSYPGEEKREHKKNEYMEIDRIVKIAKIYAEAIYRLANEGNDICGDQTILSEAETASFGQRLAEQIKKGDIICLSGELGAGKTTLAKSIIGALGVTDVVTSPTFTIMQTYQGQLPVYHFDVYRIDDAEEMHEIGFEEYLFGDGVCIIEWAEKVESILPEGCIRIIIKYGDQPDNPESRTITVERTGE